MQMEIKRKLEQQFSYQTKQTLNKAYYKKQRRPLHNDQGINPRRRYNNLNIYALNIGAPQYIRQRVTIIKGEIDGNTIIVGDFNTPLSPMDRSSKMKINKEMQALNDTLNKVDLIDIYRIPSKNNRIHFLLKCSWNVLQDRSHLGSQIKPW